jgi:hypothetical protein
MFKRLNCMITPDFSIWIVFSDAFVLMVQGGRIYERLSARTNSR